jgi:hypothetical protein
MARKPQALNKVNVRESRIIGMGIASTYINTSACYALSYQTSPKHSALDYCPVI